MRAPIASSSSQRKHPRFCHDSAGGERSSRRPIATKMVMRLGRSEEHTSELQSLMRISYAVFCLKKKKRIPSTSAKRTYVSHRTSDIDPLTHEQSNEIARAQLHTQ